MRRPREWIYVLSLFSLLLGLDAQFINITSEVNVLIEGYKLVREESMRKFKTMERQVKILEGDNNAKD